MSLGLALILIPFAVAALWALRLGLALWGLRCAGRRLDEAVAVAERAARTCDRRRRAAIADEVASLAPARRHADGGQESHSGPTASDGAAGGAIGWPPPTTPATWAANAWSGVDGLDPARN